LTLAEQRERQKLARVLHDGLQQVLVAGKLRLAMMERSHDLSARRVAQEVSELLSDSIETSRRLTAELSPPVLEESGLVAALEWLARWVEDKHQLTMHLEAQGPDAIVGQDIAIMLFHATRELLFNVVKHAGVKSARVQVVRADGDVRITVTDEGAGFDPAAIRNGRGVSGRFGLFSICERLGMLGGRLEIDSTPGQGSRFTLIAPLAAPPADEALARGRSHVSVVLPHPDARVAEGAIRVVLVDDHVIVRQGLAGLLCAEPDIAIVGEASDGASAVTLVRRVRPDVVLMDISMPGMNGIEATRIIHAEMPDVRVVGLSMFDQADQADAMRLAGAVGYLSKSGPASALVEALRRWARASECNF
jgi:CheY-like chemotaxis protein